MTALRSAARRADIGTRRDLLRTVRTYADVALLIGLIVALGAFGRPLTKLGNDLNVYPVEVLLALAGVATLARHGIRGSWALLRERLPWLPLVVFWVVGAIALARGLTDYSFDLVKNDVGMAEYSLLIPLVALVVDTRERLTWVVGAVAAGGLASVVLSIPDLWIGGEIWPIDRASPAPALTLYVTLFVVWVGVRLAQQVPTSRWMVALAFVGIVLIGVEQRRSAWVAVIVAIAVVAALAASPRRMLQSFAVGAAAVAVAAAVALPLSDVGTLGPDPPPKVEQGRLPPTLSPEEQALRELSGVVGSGQTEEAENVRWRLAIWRHDIEQSVFNPLFGVGFGKPTAFEWNGRRYDIRIGPGGDAFDVTGPHNDFVHYVQRMGWTALAAVLAIMAIGVARVWPWIRRRVQADADQTVVVTLFAMLAVATAMAAFNDALKTPYMGPIWWTLMGMMLIVPYVVRRPKETIGSGDGLDRTDIEVPADPVLQGAGGTGRR